MRPTSPQVYSNETFIVFYGVPWDTKNLDICLGIFNKKITSIDITYVNADHLQYVCGGQSDFLAFNQDVTQYLVSAGTWMDGGWPVIRLTKDDGWVHINGTAQSKFVVSGFLKISGTFTFAS